MDLRRLLIVRDTVHSEGGLPALRPVTRVAACAVIANPLAGGAHDDLSELVLLGEQLGGLLVKEAMAVLPQPPVSHGEAAIVGLDSDIEHAAAIVHPRMGRPMREAIGGGKAIIPSNVKVAAAGTAIDVPLSERDDIWQFDRIDTITVAIPGAPRRLRSWLSSRSATAGGRVRALSGDKTAMRNAAKPRPFARPRKISAITGMGGGGRSRNRTRLNCRIPCKQGKEQGILPFSV
jgi:hypothetical protein